MKYECEIPKPLIATIESVEGNQVYMNLRKSEENSPWKQ